LLGGKSMSIRIVTDSNCDLPSELIAEHGITVIPFYINVGARSFQDGIEMSHAEFYEGLPTFESQPTTSVPGPGTIVKAYEALAKEGASAILSIHIGAGLSAMVNAARLAAEEFDAVPVIVIDSGNLTLGTGFQVVKAARAAAAGHSIEEIVELVNDQALRTHCFAALDTLEYLRRSGRLSGFQSTLGSILQIKPILKMNAGNVEMERVRSRKGAIERVKSLVRELGPLENLYVVHTHALDRARLLQQEADELFPAQDATFFAEVTPVIGAHIGPGAVGFVAIEARSKSVHAI
jgi:DegV family protein with EDD domain